MSLHRHRALSRHPEHQYLTLLETLLTRPERETRNDTATRSLFGARMEFDIGRWGFPLLTTKKLAFQSIAAELIWFLSGSTNAKDLEDQGVSIWREWGDSETRDLGPVYGYQWRHWTGVTRDSDGAVEDVHVVDQITAVLASLRKDPHGRRHVVSAWNVAHLPAMALPPCHVLFQLYVEDDHRLSLQVYQRSADAFLGLPFNIASYALLLSMFARVLGRAPALLWLGGDVHLYGDHMEQARQQILREPRRLPELFLQPKPDMDHWALEDIQVRDYQPWPHIAAEVSK